MAVEFIKETLSDTPAVRAAINICEVVTPDVSDKTLAVSQIIQIAKKALRERNNVNTGAQAAASILTEKFYRKGDGQEISRKVFELVKANSKELMNP